MPIDVAILGCGHPHLPDVLGVVASERDLRLAGRLVPGFAIAWNAIGNERRTRAVADKAIRFYGGS